MTRKENREGTNVLFVLAKVAAMAAVYYCMATLYGAFASLDSKMNRVAQLDCRLELTQTCHTHTLAQYDASKSSSVAKYARSTVTKNLR